MFHWISLGCSLDLRFTCFVTLPQAYIDVSYFPEVWPWVFLRLSYACFALCCVVPTAFPGVPFLRLSKVFRICLQDCQSAPYVSVGVPYVSVGFLPLSLLFMLDFVSFAYSFVGFARSLHFPIFSYRVPLVFLHISLWLSNDLAMFICEPERCTWSA